MIEDAVIAASYAGISATLFMVARRMGAPVVTARAVAWFGAFQLACGITHGLSALAAVARPGAVPFLDAGSSVAAAGAMIAVPYFALSVLRATRSARRTAEHDARRVRRSQHATRVRVEAVLSPLQRLVDDHRLGSHHRRSVRAALRNARILLKHVVNPVPAVAQSDLPEDPPDDAMDVGIMVRRACSYFEPFARERGIQLEVHVAAGMVARWDVVQLEPVLINLLFNAFRFTPVASRIRCEAGPRASGDMFVISVADGGPGVPVILRESIFERRHAAGDSLRDHHDALGLDLSVSRELVDFHGGSISVDATPEGGALFTLTVPRDHPGARPSDVARTLLPRLPGYAIAEIAVAELERDHHAEPRNGAGEGADATDASAAAEASVAASILIVDGEPDTSALIKSSLAPGHTIVHARNIADALRAGRSMKPELVVAPVGLAGLDAAELVTALRTDSGLRTTPILLLEAAAGDTDRVHAGTTGQPHVMTSPFAPARLEERVSALVSAARARALLTGAVASRRLDLQVISGELARHRRELKTSDEATQVARELAERATLVRSNFLRMMSHELRTPITAMRLQITLLQRNSSDSAVGKRAVGGLARCTQQLLQLVDTVLEYARIESGRFEFHAQSFSLEELCGSVLDELRSHAEQKGILLDVEADPDLPALNGDARLVRLIALNLVAGAVANAQGGEVKVRLFMDGPLHSFSVTDSGPGLPREHLYEIFEPLSRLDDIRHRNGMGSGLGLAIVKEMVQALGGSIAARSDAGVGTTFTVKLPPMEQDPASAAGGPHNAPPRPEAAPGVLALPLPPGIQSTPVVHERRESSRVPVQLHVKSHGQSKFELASGDLAVGGVRVAMAHPPSHVRVEMRIALGRESASEIHMEGEVVEVSRAGSEWMAHVRFVGLKFPDEMAIANYVDEVSAQDEAG